MNNIESYLRMSETNGIICTLNRFEMPLRIRIPITVTLWNESISQLDLSVRSFNALMRCGLDTVNKVVEKINSETGLSQIRNLGRKSINEIKTVLIKFGYVLLSNNEQYEFWDYILKNNKEKIDAV